MIEENNNKIYLKYLYNNNLITYQNYLFRLKANQLKIKTYKNFGN